MAHEKSHSDPALLTGKYLSSQNFHIKPSILSVGLDTGSRVGRQEEGSQEAQGAPALPSRSEPQRAPLRSLQAPPASFRGKMQLFPRHSQQRFNMISKLVAPFFQYIQPMPASLPKTCSTPSFSAVLERGGSCPTRISQSIRQSYSSALCLDSYKAITIPRLHIHHQAFKLQKAPKNYFPLTMQPARLCSSTLRSFIHRKTFQQVQSPTKQTDGSLRGGDFLLSGGSGVKDSAWEELSSVCLVGKANLGSRMPMGSWGCRHYFPKPWGF